PAACASRMAEAGRVLLTAIRVMSCESRPTACAARKMRIRTFAIFSAIVDITDVNHLAKWSCPALHSTCLQVAMGNPMDITELLACRMQRRSAPFEIGRAHV